MTEIQTYAEFAPTQLDSRGLPYCGAPDDVGGWYVLPVSITRDSGPLERANFKTALEMLADAGIEFERPRFSHWGPGWFEILLVPPTDRAAAFVEAMTRGLEDYPVLDDEAFSLEESDEADQDWHNWRRHEISQQLEIDNMNADEICEALGLDLRQIYNRSSRYEGDPDAVPLALATVANAWRRRPCEPRAAARYRVALQRKAARW